jgi:DNA-binding NarL/FixJ family response regulator
VVAEGNDDVAGVPSGQARESPTAAHGLESLTPRQLEVLRLVARGLSNAQIAQTLFVSDRTVHAHVRMIFRKLEVGNRSLATRYAVQHGLT